MVRTDGGLDLGGTAIDLHADLDREALAAAKMELVSWRTPPLLVVEDLVSAAEEFLLAEDESARAPGHARFLRAVRQAGTWRSAVEEQIQPLEVTNRELLEVGLRAPASDVELPLPLADEFGLVVLAAVLADERGVDGATLRIVLEQLHLATPFLIEPNPLVVPEVPIPMDLEEITRGALANAAIQDLLSAVVETIDEVKLIVPLPLDSVQPDVRLCAGEQMFITNPDGWPEEELRGASVPTVAGKRRSVDAVRDGEVVVIDLPEDAASGVVWVDFNPKVNAQAFTFGVLEMPIRQQRQSFLVPFYGGKTAVVSMTVSPPSDAWGVYASEETVTVEMVLSNADAVSVEAVIGADQVMFGGNVETHQPTSWTARNDYIWQPYTATVEVPLPLLDRCRTAVVKGSASGPCDADQRPVTASFHVERTQKHLVADGTPEPRRETVRSYYLPGEPAELDVYYPTSLDEVRTAIRFLESKQRRVGAKSTGCSYHNLTTPRAADSAVIETYSILNGYWPGDLGDDAQYDARIAAQADSVTADREALRPFWSSQIRSVLPRSAVRQYEQKTAIGTMPPVDDRLVYVAAGTKIGDLERVLHNNDLALFTRGAAGHQSLAGAISTGTHGATMHLPPTSDMVRAIHLIGPGGIAWWVEPSDHMRITNAAFNPPTAISRLHISEGQDSCTRVVYDNDLFDSLLVSMGAAGVIVGYVVECVPKHAMTRQVLRNKPNPDSNPNTPVDPFLNLSWEDDILPALEREVLRQGGPSPEFWFFAPTVSSNGQGWLDTQQLADPQGALPGEPAADEDSDCCKTAIDVLISGGGAVGTGVIAGLLGAEVKALTLEMKALGPFALFRAKYYLRRIKAITNLIELLAQLPQLAASPDDPEELAATVSKALNALLRVGTRVPGLPFIIRRLFDQILEKIVEGQLKLKRESPNWSHFVLGSCEPGRPNRGYKGSPIRWFATSHEYAMSADQVPAVVGELLAFARRRRDDDLPTVFQMNLRFTRKSRALAAPQQESLTGHIEVFSFHNVDGTPQLYQLLAKIPNKYDAIPHWGQRMEMSGGRRFSTWSDAIASMSTDPAGVERPTFATDFIREQTGLHML